MPHARYPAFPVFDFPERSWPNQRLLQAPRWCSVDLRDGNQALVEPMGWERKIRLFETLVEIGFAEIEVGFPSASQTEFDFVRRLIEEDRIPTGVTIQVLTQCREDLIDRTFEAIRGAPQSIVHFYNSTSELQRRVVFREGREGVRQIAERAAVQIRERANSMGSEQVRFEYSPESFSGTEIDFALEVCESVMQIVGASPQTPIILNLPATVEMATPNVYADQIELFARGISNREAAILSVHPHNDRGCAVAAAELGCLAGADRVEGTLFGNGERTGNVDLVTLALNLMSQGIDPELDFRDLPGLVRRVEEANRLPVHPRHPYAGELVFTAFSGSHQDAIRKGLSSIRSEPGDVWEVPYLPIDPVDVGGTYEAVIRINSQSGKGGIAYRLENEFGYALPRRMQIEFAQRVQSTTDASGEEIEADALRALFEQTYLRPGDGPHLVGTQEIRSRAGGSRDEVRAAVEWRGQRIPIRGIGAGPLDAFVNGVNEAFGLALRVGDYHEHAIGEGAGATAVAYVELVFDAERRRFGVGSTTSIVEAVFAAVLSAMAGGIAAGWEVAQPEEV